MMEVESQDSQDIYVGFFKLQLKKLIIKLIPFLAICAFFIIGNIVDHFTWSKLITPVGSIILIFAALYYLLLLRYVIQLKRKYAKDKNLREKRTLKILDEGLEQVRGDQTLLRSWNTIKSANANERYIYLTQVDKKMIVIPKKDFATEIDALNFLGELDAYIRKANPYYFPGFNTIPKPNYKLGFLCLIPLIGGIAGLIFFLQGIFKYKDRWFALIGLGGIIITVTVYGSLFLFSQSATARKQMIPVSQMEMNSIIKEIEFYKTQNGSYPDSLQQLQLKNAFVNIHDPVLKDGSNSIFNYHRIGNKYTLFSSGIDQIPGTADDIYPSLKIDTSKVGLLVK